MNTFSQAIKRILITIMITEFMTNMRVQHVTFNNAIKGLLGFEMVLFVTSVRPKLKTSLD